MKRLYISRIEGDLLHFRIFHFGFDKIGKLLKDEIKQGLTGWLHQLEEFLKEEGVTAIQEIPVICFGISTFKMMSWAWELMRTRPSKSVYGFTLRSKVLKKYVYDKYIVLVLNDDQWSEDVIASRDIRTTIPFLLSKIFLPSMEAFIHEIIHFVYPEKPEDEVLHIFDKFAIFYNKDFRT